MPDMDKRTFAEIQKECCWFTLPIFEKLPDIDPTQNIMDPHIWRDDVCVQRHVFAMIFGAHGYSVNLAEANAIIIAKLEQLERIEPKNKSMDNPAFARWIGLFAQYYVLWGTVFAYRSDYVIAAQCMMNGLKTGAINLFMPYCDFIRYVLSRVERLPAEDAEYHGCGFSVDDPMGSDNMGGGVLLAQAAELIIPALEGDNGEIVLAYQGNMKYGNLRRLGSTCAVNSRNMIDVYEVLIVDRRCRLKKMKLYFNGYFDQRGRYTIKLPDGFRLDPLSRAAKIFEVVD